MTPTDQAIKRLREYTHYHRFLSSVLTDDIRDLIASYDKQKNALRKIEALKFVTPSKIAKEALCEHRNESLK